MIISDFIYGLRTHKRNTHLKDFFITQLYKFAVNLLSFWTSTIFWAWYSTYFLLHCWLIFFFKNSIATWSSDCSSHSQWISLYCISSWNRTGRCQPRSLVTQTAKITRGICFKIEAIIFYKLFSIHEWKILPQI